MQKILTWAKKALAYSKAIAALVGGTSTYLLSVLPADQYKWLGIVAAVATAVGTWAIPNIPFVAPVTPAPAPAPGPTPPAPPAA